ncbi:hypothetical protein KAT24_01460 [Candidatus Pacearchaeota archaeon]|nr:hypothetical protein [Candidatus Pacearchaeota archaeon]
MKSQKAIIFDASTIITFAMNGFLPELKKLKEMFDGKFLIPSDVKREIVDKPMKIKRFALEALKVNELFNEKVLEMPDSLKINESLISKKTQEFKDFANNLFEAKGKYLHLIDLGEASCLALSRILDEKGIKNVIAVDERTTRMLGEKPENLENLLRRKLHTKIVLKKENFKFFEGFKFIRSAELIYVAYKKGIIKLKNNVLEALLYAVKSKGCAISGDEIKEIKRL